MQTRKTTRATDAKPRAPTGTTRRRTAEQTQQRILDAAEGLFAERGPDTVGLKDVARAARVSHPLVVHYFESYENLVHAVLRRKNRQIGEEVLQRLLTEDGPLMASNALGALLRALGDPTHARLLAWAALSGAAERLAIVRNQGLARIVEGLRARFEREAKARGARVPALETFDQRMVVAAAAVLGFATCRSILMPALGQPIGPDADASFERMLRAVVFGPLIEPLEPRARNADD